MLFISKQVRAWSVQFNFWQFQWPKVSMQSLKKYYLGHKNRYSRDIHEVDLQFDHVTVILHGIDFGSTSTQPLVSARRELALQIEVDSAWYYAIEQRTYLINFLAVTIIFARVVQGQCWHGRCGASPWPKYFQYVTACLRNGKQKYGANEHVNVCNIAFVIWWSCLRTLFTGSCGISCFVSHTFSSRQTGWKLKTSQFRTIL